MLHVAELNWEAVGRVADFFFAHQQRRGIAELAPPAQDGLAVGQFARRDVFEDAENVEVGEAVALPGGRGGTIEDDGD